MDAELYEHLAVHWLAAIRSAIFPVYLCRHEKLNGTSGTCPDCGWAVQVFNPYGGLSSDPVPKQREYSEHELAQGRAIAGAIGK